MGNAEIGYTTQLEEQVTEYKLLSEKLEQVFQEIIGERNLPDLVLSLAKGGIELIKKQEKAYGRESIS